jgi:hypothetical protein
MLKPPGLEKEAASASPKFSLKTRREPEILNGSSEEKRENSFGGKGGISRFSCRISREGLYRILLKRQQERLFVRSPSRPLMRPD